MRLYSDPTPTTRFPLFRKKVSRAINFPRSGDPQYNPFFKAERSGAAAEYFLSNSKEKRVVIMPTVSPGEKSKKYPNLNTGLYGKLTFALTRFCRIRDSKGSSFLPKERGKSHVWRLAISRTTVLHIKKENKIFFKSQIEIAGGDKGNSATSRRRKRFF